MQKIIDDLYAQPEALLARARKAEIADDDALEELILRSCSKTCACAAAGSATASNQGRSKAPNICFPASGLIVITVCRSFENRCQVSAVSYPDPTTGLPDFLTTRRIYPNTVSRKRGMSSSASGLSAKRSRTAVSSSGL